MCVMSSQGLTMKWMTKNIVLYKIYMVLRLNIYCISYMYIILFKTIISFLEKKKSLQPQFLKIHRVKFTTFVINEIPFPIQPRQA